MMISVAFALLAFVVGVLFGRKTDRAYHEGFRDAHTICHQWSVERGQRKQCNPRTCYCANLERREERWDGVTGYARW